ncbi:M23 family metallopeptidase [Leucobacter sp. HY1908]
MTGAPVDESAQSSAASPAGASDKDAFTPLVGEVLAAPEAVPSTDSKMHLAYELLLTNVLGQQLTVDALTVVGDGDELLALQGDALTPWVRPLGAAAPTRTLAPGQQAIITLDVKVASPDAVPRALTHAVTLSPAEAMPPMIESTMTQQIAPVDVSEQQPVVIGSPVQGAGWLDGNSCCEVTPHRSAVNPINGGLYAPERFAIDFVQLDEEGRIFDGAIDDLSSYAYYGADLVAVADGPIVSMEWSLPEAQPGAHPGGLELSQYGGNNIVQDIGDGRYAFYAHLQGANPQGLKVGQELKRGDVIGQLGNSGNTDMPHLHFHVMSSPSPLGSNGLPFLIDSFTLVGTVTNDNLMACMEQAISCETNASGSTGAADGTAMADTGLLYRDVIDVAG